VSAAVPQSERFVLVAKSFSTPLAVWYAATNPQNLAAVIICAGFVGSPVHRWSGTVKALAKPWLFWLKPPRAIVEHFLLGQNAPPDLLEKLRRALHRVSPDILSGRVLEVLDCDARDDLGRTTVPMLYLEATYDRLLSSSCKEEFSQLRPDITRATEGSNRHDGSKSLANIGQSDLVPPPTFVLETSPDKFQVIWKVDDINPEQAEALLHALAHQFEGDPAATDSTRVLRLPGFANKKYEEDFLVKVHSHTGRTHHLRDFKLRTEPVDSGPARWNRPPERSASKGPRELSQSERDWAYAKRALSRGVPPEEIMRDIAEFRAHDKHDPADYARRTVTKAQIEVAASNSRAGGDLDARPVPTEDNERSP